MNTNHTPRTLLALSAALSMGLVACDGGSASMSVADGLVTETHEVMSADGLVPVQVELTYPEGRLAEVGHAGIVLVPRTSAPRRGVDTLSGPTARPTLTKTIETLPSRLAVVVPRTPGCERYTAGCHPVPGWMKLRMDPEVAAHYEVRLLADGPAMPGPGPDERLEGARARR